MPKIEPLHQNTPQWHRWRQQGIGASDAPVIMGDAAFKTPRQLWSIKTGRMPEDAAGPAARRGRELERLARRAYEQKVGIQMEPLCLVHDQLEWKHASLDGLSFDGWPRSASWQPHASVRCRSASGRKLKARTLRRGHRPCAED